MHPNSTEFAKRRQSHLRNHHLDPMAYDRALSTRELCELLDVGNIELELLLVNNLLRPSLFLEYHEGNYLGFFSYWDCLSTVISRVVSPEVQAIDGIFDVIDASIDVATEVLRTKNRSSNAKIAGMKRLISVAIHEGLSGAVNPPSTQRCDLWAGEVCKSIMELEDRFHCLMYGAAPITMAPLALVINDET